MIQLAEELYVHQNLFKVPQRFSAGSHCTWRYQSVTGQGQVQSLTLEAIYPPPTHSTISVPITDNCLPVAEAGGRQMPLQSSTSSPKYQQQQQQHPLRWENKDLQEH